MGEKTALYKRQEAANCSAAKQVTEGTWKNVGEREGRDRPRRGWNRRDRQRGGLGEREESGLSISGRERKGTSRGTSKKGEKGMRSLQGIKPKPSVMAQKKISGPPLPAYDGPFLRLS